MEDEDKMAAVQEKHTFKGSLKDVFAGLSDYPAYPDHLPGVTQIKVLPAQKEGSSCQVRYDINLIKKFHYTLDMFEESPTKIWWSLADSNLMKKNEGSWELSQSGKSTEANYSLEVTFRGLVPSAVTNKIAQANLPSMFAGFQEMINDNKS
jgi:ribosome-associated toxin RatA of RatAB toxin-antitoxin module